MKHFVMLEVKKNNSCDDFQTDVARTSSCCNGNGRLCSLQRKKNGQNQIFLFFQNQKAAGNFSHQVTLYTHFLFLSRNATTTTTGFVSGVLIAASQNPRRTFKKQTKKNQIKSKSRPPGEARGNFTSCLSLSLFRSVCICVCARVRRKEM